MSENGTAGDCADGKALEHVAFVAVSPDDLNVYASSGASDAIAVLDRDPTTGELFQEEGPAGCISEDGSGGECVDGRALNGPGGIAVSPDGSNVYVGSFFSDAVAVLDRVSVTGNLAQRPGPGGCVSNDGTGGQCAIGRALRGVTGVAISPDGGNVYAVSRSSRAIAIFDRDPVTGEIVQKPGLAGCISEDGSDGECTDGRAIDGLYGVTVGPMGTSVYSASDLGDSVAIFDRDPANGELAQKPGLAGCISETGSGGECTDGKALVGPASIAVSFDGIDVYVASAFSNAVAVFDRDPATGDLVQKAGRAGCVSEDGAGGECADGKALEFAASVAVAPDGLSVYVGSPVSDAIAVFDRDPATGELLQKSGTSGCVSEDGTGGDCADGKALDGAHAMGVALDTQGAHVYVASAGSDAVATFARTGVSIFADGFESGDASAWSTEVP